ncbi:MAG: chromosome partitioning protein ParB, partial [Proteobacteria bacterium]|nr:chromosome partitioning protein ParB [Pseudomonadota bacterium]
MSRSPQAALPVTPGDPWIPAEGPQPMQVEVERIKCYERNPRRLENPQYDRIKASIRARGMDQPLFITCRPGESDYIVQAGGNTRLRILKELHAHTGEARYAHVHCLLRPWTCESDVLLAHLRENELRGNLPFIDKAQAVLEARALLEEEQGSPLTQRALEARLRERGYSITHGRISLMEYAATTLVPWIPQALEAGLGKLQVARIRALHRAGARLWKRYCPDCETAFDALFAVLCRRYDGPDWDGAALQGAVEVEIALEAELGLHTVRTALDAELQGRIVTFPAPEPEPQDPPPAPARPQAAKTELGLGSGSTDPADPEARALPY